MTAAAAIADARLKKAKHREIAIRYRNGRKPLSMAALRCAEIDRLLVARYGTVLPADDAGAEDARIMAHHLALMSGDPRRRITAWTGKRTPWMAPDAAERLIEQTIAKPLRWRADKLGKLLNLVEADRRRLGITTIGAADVTKEQRAAARKARKREAMQRRRRNAGAKPRSEYEAAAAGHGKPWEAEGVSRATWYRRHRDTAK